MIKVKSPREIELMRRAGKITAAARTIARDMVMPGAQTREIDREIHSFITKSGAVPSFLNYNGYPASVCISINEEVIHGIPGTRRIAEGDVVSVDVGAFIGGFHGDCAGSYVAGRGAPEAERLVRITRECFFKGIQFARQGYRVSDISAAIQEHAEANGYSLVRDFVGHGIGEKLHEAPEVPNFGQKGHGPRLIKGMTLAIEPMVNEGGAEIRILGDKWTVVTNDGKLSAHYENTILITDGEPEILTISEDM